MIWGDNDPFFEHANAVLPLIMKVRGVVLLIVGVMMVMMWGDNDSFFEHANAGLPLIMKVCFGAVGRGRAVGSVSGSGSWSVLINILGPQSHFDWRHPRRKRDDSRHRYLQIAVW